jgi:glycerol uptake facilitator-like aquaporin
LAVTFLGLAFGRDVQFNPAFTLALWTARRVGTVKAVLYIASQLLGGFAAYTLYKYFAANHMVQPLPSDYKGTILVAEAFGAFVFAFGAAGALYRQYHPLVRSVVTGGAYTLGVMIASVAAAGFINPAVAVASNAWVWTTYVLGPVVGALVGVNLYGLLFADRDLLVRQAATSAGTASVVPATVTKPADKASVKTSKTSKTAKSKKTKK